MTHCIAINTHEFLKALESQMVRALFLDPTPTGSSTVLVDANFPIRLISSCRHLYFEAGIVSSSTAASSTHVASCDSADQRRLCTT